MIRAAEAKDFVEAAVLQQRLKQIQNKLNPPALQQAASFTEGHKERHQEASTDLQQAASFTEGQKERHRKRASTTSQSASFREERSTFSRVRSAGERSAPAQPVSRRALQQQSTADLKRVSEEYNKSSRRDTENLEGWDSSPSQPAPSVLEWFIEGAGESQPDAMRSSMRFRYSAVRPTWPSPCGYAALKHVPEDQKCLKYRTVLQGEDDINEKLARGELNRELEYYAYCGSKCRRFDLLNRW